MIIHNKNYTIYSYGHKSKNCRYEKNESYDNKLLMGKTMEQMIACNYKCPKCKHWKLYRLGNNTPSLDIVCLNCLKKSQTINDNFFLEVKSKCLSVAGSLPKDIYLLHGVYNKYISMVNNGLNLVIVIYGVDRKTNSYYYRRILYIPNKILKYNSNKNVTVLPLTNGLSKIKIKNIYELDSWEITDFKKHKLSNNIYDVKNDINLENVMNDLSIFNINDNSTMINNRTKQIVCYN